MNMEIVKRHHRLCKCDFVAPNYCARCLRFFDYVYQKCGADGVRLYKKIEEEGRMLDAMTPEECRLWLNGGEITKH
jgi:hypothetical protein